MVRSVSRGSVIDRRQSFLRTALEMRSGTPEDSPMTLSDVMSDPDIRDLRTPNVVPGEAAYDFSLRRLDDPQEPVQLSQFAGRKPVALVFGSYTCPPFRVQLDAVDELYRRYSEGVAFFMIYIREAHPEEGWVLERNRAVGISIHDPTSFDERVAIATSCVARMRVNLPVLVDEPDNEVARYYGGWPIRLYLIDRDGRVAYQSDEGPFGFKPAQLRRAIEAQLSRSLRGRWGAGAIHTATTTRRAQ
jgi:hypothetical protein